MKVLNRLTPGWLVLASLYVAVVAGVAAWGFVQDSTALILLAAALALPSSVVALPGYYLVYGLLAQVPGANPSESTGSSVCTTTGDCSAQTTGDVATWFQITTDGIGILALACAAVLNVFLLLRIAERRRALSGSGRRR